MAIGMDVSLVMGSARACGSEDIGDIFSDEKQKAHTIRDSIITGIE